MYVHFILLADVEVVERGTDELQGLVQGVRVQATRVQNVHPKAYVPAIENEITLAGIRAPSTKILFIQNPFQLDPRKTLAFESIRAFLYPSPTPPHISFQLSSGLINQPLNVI